MCTTVPDPKQKRRDHLCIIADMLDTARHGALKTQIMYKANLSFTQLNEYLDFLVTNNLIIQTTSEGKEIYLITRKGSDFLRKHIELTRMLNNNSNAKNDRPSTQCLLA